MDLLYFFEQNKDKINKYDVPVMMPPVVARTYAKTSSYRFA